MGDNKQPRPPLVLDRFMAGLITNRSQLVTPLRAFGINILQLHDCLIDGLNMELTDRFTLQRRPGFTPFCTQQLAFNEIANQFYGVRNLEGVITDFVDTNIALYTMTTSALTPILAKHYTTATITSWAVTSGVAAFNAINSFTAGQEIVLTSFASAYGIEWFNGQVLTVLAAGLTNTTFSVTLESAAPDNSFTETGTATTLTAQTYVQQVGDLTYLANGTDLMIWNNTLQTLLPWGVAAPTTPPIIQQTLVKPGFWSVNTQYSQGQALLDSNGNIELASVVDGNSGTTIPVWPTVPLGTVIDGGSTVTWKMLGGIGLWIGSIPYAIPNVVLDSNNNLQYVTTAGTSGTAIPTWNATFGGTTTDGTVTWTNIGPGIVVAYSGYSYVYCFRTVDGDLSTASPISTATGPILNSVPITPIQITSYEISGGIITFFANNFLSAGQQLILEEFANSTFLNGTMVQVIPGGLSTTQFECETLLPDQAQTFENGVGNPVIAVLAGARSPDPRCNSVATITNISLTANEVTVTCANQFTPGISVGMSGLVSATFLNGQTLYVDNATPTQFTASFVHDDYASMPDVGSATLFAVEIYRLADGGGTFFLDGAVLNPAAGAPAEPYTSPIESAGIGTDVSVPSGVAWVNPNNVTSPSAYATNLQAPPGSGGDVNFNIVQEASSESGTTTNTATFPNPVTVGHIIIATFGSFIRTDGGDFPPSITSVTDNLGNTYTLKASTEGTYDGGSSQFFPYSGWVYTAPVTVAGTCTITAHLSSGGVIGPLFQQASQEVSGMQNIIDVQANVGNTCGGSLNCGSGFHPVFYNTGSVTTTNATDVIYSVIVLNAIAGPVLPSGFTSGASNTFGRGFTFGAYHVQTSNASYSPTWYCSSGTGNAVGMTIAFKLVAYGTGSDLLQAQQFGFAIPAGVNVKGIQLTFDAIYNGGAGLGTIFAQLLRNGAPFGSVFSITPTGSAVEYTLGSSTNLWNETWLYSDFNNPLWGVQFTASLQAQGGGPFTFSIGDVQAQVFGETQGVQWAFYDTATDRELDTEIIAPQNHLNDPPPGVTGSLQAQGGTILAWWQGRLWMAVGNFLYFDGGPDIINGNPEACWPPANVFTVPGKITGIAPTTQGLLVFTADTTRVILGGPQTLTFYDQPLLENFGISNSNCLRQDGDALYVYTTSKQYFSIIAGGGKTEDGQRIAFTISQNFDPTSTQIAMHRNGEDAGVYLADEGQILRFGLNTQCWSPIYAPVGGVGAMNSIETGLGVYSLLIAPHTPGGYVLERNLTTFADGFTPTAYDAFVTIGSITITTLGQVMVPLWHISGYFANTGTLPTISFLPNEISFGGANFVPLPVAINEPPIGAAPSTTLIAKRWPTNMNQERVSQLVHTVQVKVDFGNTDEVPNEVLAIGLHFDNE